MSSGCPVHHHGTTKALGCQHAGFASFGLLCADAETAEDVFVPDPPRFEPSDDLVTALGRPGGLMDDEERSSDDAIVPAGYTFFAQFVDHDITLDTQSKLNERGQEPGSFRNQRTASLDLDCVYGLGPEANPHLYDASRSGFLATAAPAGRPWDLARSDTGVALIGDPRNDENIFISQIQLLWIRFHNRLMLSSLGAGNTPGSRFEHVQECVRHHYQYIVLHDMLRRMCHPKTFGLAIERINAAAAERRAAQTAGDPIPDPPPSFPSVFRHFDAHHRVPMPIEFSAAAFRFGHTTVRASYPANAVQLDIELFDERFGTLGFSSLPESLAVDWRYLLEVDPDINPVRTKAFDHLLPTELIRMPDPIVGRTSDNNRSLAFRNLVRGRSLGLPSGEALAAKMAAAYETIDVLPMDTLFAPAAFPGKGTAAGEARGMAETADDGSAGTPLFFYLMREAATSGHGRRLGPLGSAILLEVFGRMLVDCGTSFLYLRDDDGTFRDFEPDPQVLGEPAERAARQAAFAARMPDPDADDGDPAPALELADIVRYASAG